MLRLSKLRWCELTKSVKNLQNDNAVIFNTRGATVDQSTAAEELEEMER